MSDLISRQQAIEIVERYNKSHMVLKQQPMLGAASIVIELEELPSVQPKQRWIPVTKEEVFKAGYEGREIRFRVNGRLFAIRELAQ